MYRHRDACRLMSMKIYVDVDVDTYIHVEANSLHVPVCKYKVCIVHGHTYVHIYIHVRVHGKYYVDVSTRIHTHVCRCFSE